MTPRTESLESGAFRAPAAHTFPGRPRFGAQSPRVTAVTVGKGVGLSSFVSTAALVKQCLPTGPFSSSCCLALGCFLRSCRFPPQVPRLLRRGEAVRRQSLQVQFLLLRMPESLPVTCTQGNLVLSVLLPQGGGPKEGKQHAASLRWSWTVWFRRLKAL